MRLGFFASRFPPPDQQSKHAARVRFFVVSSLRKICSYQLILASFNFLYLEGHEDSVAVPNFHASNPFRRTRASSKLFLFYHRQCRTFVFEAQPTGGFLDQHDLHVRPFVHSPVSPFDGSAASRELNAETFKVSVSARVAPFMIELK